MRKFFLGLIALGLVAGAVMFYSCQKDGELKVTNSQVVKPVGNLEGVVYKEYNVMVPGRWGFDYNGNYVQIENDHADMVCIYETWTTMTDLFGRTYKVLVETKYVICGTGEVINTIYYSSTLRPEVLGLPATEEIDYADINNFIITVDNYDVVPDFSYEKPFVFEIKDGNDEIISIRGSFLIDYEQVMDLFLELQEVWHK